ncbi:MAG: polysaccharide pyruvyl transferase family protein [Bacteroidota bacterium]
MINIYNIRPKGFNVGNDVIHLALIHFVREAFKQHLNIISLPATSKYESQKKAGLSSQTIYEVNQFGDGLIVGGGNLYENNELEINPVALKALSVPMMLFSMSRGDIYNKKLVLSSRTDVIPDDKLRLLNQASNYSLSRDKATCEYISSLGCENVVGGCPTLFLNEMPQHLVPISKDDQTDALISIRTPTLMSIPVSHQYNIKTQIENIIDLLKTKGYSNIKILCHDHRDIPFADSFETVEFLYTSDVYTYLSYLKNTRLNITYRLHSFLPAMSYGIPAVKLSYDQRALSMLDTVGLDDWNINIVKDDVLLEIEKRIDALGDINQIRESLSSSVWPDLKNTMTSNLTAFATDVMANK